MQAVAYKSILVSGDYSDDMPEWEKLTDVKQTWEAWKVKFMAAYADMKILEVVQESIYKPFGGTAPVLPPRTHLGQPTPPTKQITNYTVDKLLGYLDSILIAATTASGGKELAELAASLAIIADTNAVLARELKQTRI